MEMSVVNKSDMPIKPDWKEKIHFGLKEIKQSNGKLDMMKFIFKKGENSAGLERAWRVVCRNELKKIPHVRSHCSVVGKTIWLWYE